jgi:hypothetical protein
LRWVGRGKKAVPGSYDLSHGDSVRFAISKPQFIGFPAGFVETQNHTSRSPKNVCKSLFSSLLRPNSLVSPFRTTSPWLHKAQYKMVRAAGVEPASNSMFMR